MSMVPLSYIIRVMEDDADFQAAALRELERIQGMLKLKSTYTLASSASALLDCWLVNRELKCYERGRVVDDVTAAIAIHPEHGIDAIEDAWQIDISELARLMESRGMSPPGALIAESGWTPEDDLPNECGYTIRGAARALAQKYDLPEDAIRKRLIEAAERGKLTVRDPQTGLPYTPETRRDFYERISIEDLNIWFKDSGVEYRLGDSTDPTGKVESEKQSNKKDSSLTPMKKQALLTELRRYRELRNALQANEPEFVECRVPKNHAPGKKGGYYYLEKVKAVCLGRWGGDATPTTQPSRNEKNLFSAQVRGMLDGKKY